jgi:hypothetical protein
MGKGLRYLRQEDMPPGLRLKVQEQERHGEQPVAARRKYGNHVTHVDGIRFDSKREAAYYQKLKVMKQGGMVSYWLRQVPLHLPGGTRLVVDFLVFYTDGRAPDYVDVKGRETKEFKIKRREIQHHYPIQVVLA